MAREAGPPTTQREEPELSLEDLESLLVAGEEIGAWLSDEIPAAAFAAATAQIVEAIQADPTLTTEEKLDLVQYANSFLRGALGDTDPDVQPDLREAVRIEIQNSWGVVIHEESETMRLELRRESGSGESGSGENPGPELGSLGLLPGLFGLTELPAVESAAIQEYADDMLREIRAELDARDRQSRRPDGDECGTLPVALPQDDDTCGSYDQCVRDNRRDAHDFADAMTYAQRQLAAAYCIPVAAACRGVLRRTYGCMVARRVCNSARGAVRRAYNSHYEDYIIGQCGSEPIGCI